MIYINVHTKSMHMWGYHSINMHNNQKWSILMTMTCHFAGNDMEAVL
jgi:hypothetical protein